MRLHSLTGLRFLAALMVFLHHTLAPGIVTGGLASVPRTVALADVGLTGVTFFFVLSGFVLTWAWSDRLPRISFYGRRFARVYPLHLLFFVVAVVVVLPVTGRRLPDLGEAVANLLLVQTWFSDPFVFFSANAPSWSLACEAAFYASLPFLLPALRALSPRGRLLAAAGAVATLAAVPLLLHALVEGRFVLLALWVFPPYRACEFVLGVLLALALKDGWRPRWTVTQAAVATGLSLVLASRVLDHFLHSYEGGTRVFGQLYADLLVLLPMAGLIAAVAVHDLGGRPSWLARPLWRGLGDASFAFYLCHVPVILLVHELVPHSVASLGRGLPLTAAVLALSLLVAWGAHAAVERPVEAWLRARLPAARPGPVSEAEPAPAS